MLSPAPQVIAVMVFQRIADSLEDVERDERMLSLVYDPGDSGFGRPAVAACAT